MSESIGREAPFGSCALPECDGMPVNMWARGRDPWTDLQDRYCSRAHAYVGHERERIASKLAAWSEEDIVAPMARMAYAVAARWVRGETKEITHV